MSVTNSLLSTMPLLQLQTHDRDRDAFHWRLSCVTLNTTDPFRNSSQTQTKPTLIHGKKTNTHKWRVDLTVFFFDSNISAPSPFPVFMWPHHVAWPSIRAVGVILRPWGGYRLSLI